MSSRVGLRFTRFAQAFKNPIGRRYQTADATAAAPTQQGTFQKLWNSPIGIKTVHFWAPVMKWSIVLAGISDLSRPARSLSLSQNLALTCTGAIWTRWCFIIKPRNILLATVNFFLMCVGITQTTRIMLYRKSIEGKSAEEIAEEIAKDAKATATSITMDPEGAAKKAVN